MEDRIEKHMQIAAPVSRVWLALTDSRQFGEWFLVKIDGPLSPRKRPADSFPIRDNEHLRMEIEVKAIKPDIYFLTLGIPMRLTRQWIIPWKLQPWWSFGWRR